MSGIAWAPIHPEPESLLVLDVERRLYAALRSLGKSYHLVQPATLDDPRVGDGKVALGDLVCTCPAGLYRAELGACWAVKAALMFEGRPDVAVDQLPWMDSPAGAGEMVEASRG